MKAAADCYARTDPDIGEGLIVGMHESAWHMPIASFSLSANGASYALALAQIHSQCRLRSRDARLVEITQWVQGSRDGWRAQLSLNTKGHKTSWDLACTRMPMRSTHTKYIEGSKVACSAMTVSTPHEQSRAGQAVEIAASSECLGV